MAEAERAIRRRLMQEAGLAVLFSMAQPLLISGAVTPPSPRAEISDRAELRPPDPVEMLAARRRA